MHLFINSLIKKHGFRTPSCIMKTEKYSLSFLTVQTCVTLHRITNKNKKWTYWYNVIFRFPPLSFTCMSRYGHTKSVWRESTALEVTWVCNFSASCAYTFTFPPSLHSRQAEALSLSPLIFFSQSKHDMTYLGF